MKKAFLSLIPLLIFAFCGMGELYAQVVDSGKLIESVYDEKAKQTTFFVSNMMTIAEELGPEVYSVTEGRKVRLPSSIIKMVVYFKYPGKQRVVPEKVIIAFDSGHYRAYRFGVDRDLTILADGEKIALGKMQLTDRRDVGDKNNLFGNVHMWETLELPIDLAQYRKIIDAKGVSITVGDAAAHLSSDQLKRLRNFADKYLKS